MAMKAGSDTVAAPFAKFVELGDTLIGAFGSNPDECRRQSRNFTDGKPATKPDGSPRLEEVMHFIAMPGTTAKVGTDERGYTPIEAGAHVRHVVSGFKWGQVIEARNNLPAANGFGPGEACSGDVYEIRLVGWSATTENAAAAAKAGFTVVDGRIVLRSQQDKDNYVLAKSRQGGNTNVGKDFEVTIRRPSGDEKRWEQAADELFLQKPWTVQAAPPAPEGDTDTDGSTEGASAPAYDTSEPF